MPIKIAYSSKKVKRRWFPPLDREIVMKKIYFPKNMVRADVFLQVLWQFLSVWLRRLSEFSRGAFLSTCGGEIRSNYFKYSAQMEAVRPARLKFYEVKFWRVPLTRSNKNRVSPPFLKSYPRLSAFQSVLIRVLTTTLTHSTNFPRIQLGGFDILNSTRAPKHQGQ